MEISETCGALSGPKSGTLLIKSLVVRRLRLSILLVQVPILECEWTTVIGAYAAGSKAKQG